MVRELKDGVKYDLVACYRYQIGELFKEEYKGINADQVVEIIERYNKNKRAGDYAELKIELEEEA